MKHSHGIVKADHDFEMEGRRQLRRIGSAAAAVLYQQYGWRELRIKRVFCEFWNVWLEIGKDNGTSIVQKLEMETLLYEHIKDTDQTHS